MNRCISRWTILRDPKPSKRGTKGLTGDNLRIFRRMSEITSFDGSYFLATRAKIWVFYLPSTPKSNTAPFICSSQISGSSVSGG